MPIKSLIVFLLISSIASCDSIRLIHSSSKSKSDYWKLNAFTMSHCGCTELFAEIYSSGKHTSQIWYTNTFAQKNIFRLNDKGEIADTLVLIATQEEPEIAFDSLDNEILRTIQMKIEQNDGIVYKMHWEEYKGFKKKG
jgi:hypothetical protein